LIWDEPARLANSQEKQNSLDKKTKKGKINENTKKGKIAESNRGRYIT
jgi:hypothetical protein